MNTTTHAIVDAKFSVNGRHYHPPAIPIAIVCIDGCADEYLSVSLAKGEMPNLAKVLKTGHRSLVRGALPSFTNVNNSAMVTGCPPSQTGIGGNYIIDPETGEEVMTNSSKYLRLETILAAAANAGRKVAMVTAKVLLGGNRNGAQLEPTVIDNVSRDAEMIRKESFGPLAPIISISDIDDAIAVANDSDFGLSSGVVTNNLAASLECIRRIRTGTVNINQVPGYRIECSPFGGVKDSGLGIKEGVIEAMKFMTNIKTFSLPW